MDKDTIITNAGRYAAAAAEAQQWVERNEDRVRGCGKSKDEVLASLRRQAREFRKLERAASRRMCAGVFGPSQAGKSYLLGSLARNPESKKTPCRFGSEEYDFLEKLNPGGNRESTGLVTRFTMTPPPNIPAGYPVHVRLLSETELVKIFANTYFCDCEHKGKVDKADIEVRLSALRERSGNPGPHITLDALEDLREYITNSFGGRSRAAALEEVYWDEAVKMALGMSLEDRVKLFGIIWDSIPEFNDMFLSLAADLAKLGNPEEAFCSMDALVPREASVIDVDTLQRTDFSGLEVDVQPYIQMCSPSGMAATIARKNASAIIAELTLVMAYRPAAYFNHTDLLDFPGYKARLECTDIRDYLHKGNKDSAVEQFFRRGKVAYLFQRYSAERELTSLLLCVAASDTTPGLAGAVEDWIIATHGKTPKDRENAKTALFHILTKSDRHFEHTAGARFETRWNDVLQGMFLGHFEGAGSQSTRWVEEWTPSKAFNNLYLLRNITIKWDSMMSIEASGASWVETGILPKKEEYHKKMRESFTGSRRVKKHFSSPETAFDELMKINDGGIEHIKCCLEPLCEPNLKLGQISASLEHARKELEATLSPFYHSGDKEEELKKKKALFSALFNLRNNPMFVERFPELLNSFKISPEFLFYMYGEAELRFSEYREKEFGIPDGTSPEPPPLFTNPFGSNPFDDNSFEDTPLKEDTFKDIHSFYAEYIIEAWSANMHEVAETDECTDYFHFPKVLLLGVLDEFDAAVMRMGIRKRLEDKFREIARPVDVPKDSKTHKQASYAVGMLNDFVSWMGHNPVETKESERSVSSWKGDVTVFRERPEIEDYPVLGDEFSNFSLQWMQDWLFAFYGVLMDNVAFTDGIKIDLQENSRLGEILEKIKQ